MITCIYCREERPPSSEHALAKSLGGNLKALITCVRCNTTILSPLDQALAERSIVALSRVAFTPTQAFDVRLGGEHFQYDPERDLHSDVTLVNGFKPYTFPQVHFRYNSHEVIVVATNHEELRSLAEFVDKHIANGTLGGIHVKVGPANRTTTARIVMHRSKDGFIRVRNAGDEQQIFAFLASHWIKLRGALLTGHFTDQIFENPEINLSIPVTPDDVYRAVAKTAFNVLATDVGVPYVLRTEFDPIREYIRGRDIRHPTPQAPDELLVDDRFVEMLTSERRPLRPTSEHLVCLFHHRAHAMASVTLYGTHSFLVMLGAVDSGGFDFAAREFSVDRTHTSALDLEDAYARLAQRK